VKSEHLIASSHSNKDKQKFKNFNPELMALVFFSFGRLKNTIAKTDQKR